MSETELPSPEEPEPGFRLEESLHQKLSSAQSRGVPLQPKDPPMNLPKPVFPRHPEYIEQVMSEKEYNRLNRVRGWKSWGIPYFKSRWHSRELRPIIAYLFTEYGCNLDCHYCWSYNNKTKGMTEDTARRSIDWLESIGCRVLALMGGEPLLRRDFVHKVVDYAGQKGFFVYLATNGRFLDPDTVVRLGDAGLSVINLAIDSVEVRPELPKAFTAVKDNLECMVKMQRHYGFTMFLNINITRINLDDVRELTEIGRSYNLATDYHINESPMMEQEHFKHKTGNSTYITPDDWESIDALIDWLIDKQKQGYKMPNSPGQLANMKNMMRGKVEPWPCRAGKNTLIIREDGTLAPCFPMYGAAHDWGQVENDKFDLCQLDEMKKSCNATCYSTLNSILGYCYNNRTVFKWLARQAFNRFHGLTGSM